MPTIIQSTDTNTTISPATGDTIIVEEGVTVSATDGLSGFSDDDLLVFIAGRLVGSDNGAELGSNSAISIAGSGALIGRSCGLWLNGAGTVAHNAGVIQSFGTGISFIVAAVALNETSDASFTNVGTVLSGGVGIHLYSSTVRTTIVNTGEITAQGDGVLSTFGGARIVNSGTIASSAGEAIDFALASAASRIENSGTILGDVLLGGGADRLRLSGAGQVIGTVSAGGGADLLAGADADDLLSGGDGDDLVRGFGGDDLVAGDAGADVLRGGDGDDVVDGGRDRDVLFGGAGADRFVYDEIADSGNGGSLRDAIKDFVIGQDVIDVSALSPGTFAFIGGNVFSGTAPELRVQAVGGASGNTFVEIDVDGNGTRDMQIVVEAVRGLTATDFIL